VKNVRKYWRRVLSFVLMIGGGLIALWVRVIGWQLTSGEQWAYYWPHLLISLTLIFGGYGVGRWWRL
jgi:hypothetical protein